MPLYEFYCARCDCCFEVRRSLSQGTADVVCPACAGDEVRRVFTPVAAFSSSSSGQRAALSGSSGCAGCAATHCAGCASARHK
jgi:putative FmdB family regulatory protein